MPYWEGQSYGVIPPGTNPKNGKPHTVRLYSIASSRYGDNMAGKTSSLCVRRATYWDPDMGKEDPAKKGVCSNFLCDSKPGASVKITGAVGKGMLLPDADEADAPAGEQSWDWESPDGYQELTVAAVEFARGLRPPPLTTAESRAAMRVVFAGYAAAESGSTQRVAQG